MTGIFCLASMSMAVGDSHHNFPILTKMEKNDIKLSESIMRLAVTKIY